MPRIQRSDLPKQLLEPLCEQASARNLSVDALIARRHWLDCCPEVPEGPWFKRFTDFTFCGEGALPKTFLLAGMLPCGPELK